MTRRIWMAALLLGLLLVASVGTASADGWDGDKFVFNEEFVLRAGETIDGNLAVVAGTAVLEQGSFVSGDVAAFGGKLSVQGTVRGNIALFGGSAVLSESSELLGDLAAFGASVERAPGAIIRGEVYRGLSFLPRAREPVPPLSSGSGPSRPQTWDLFTRFMRWQGTTFASILLLAVLGIAAVLLAPRGMGRIASAAATQPAMNFGVGFLTLVVGALGGTLLLIACGLGLLVWIALATGWLAGWLAIGLWWGQRLLVALKVRGASSVAHVAVGVALITVAARLPLCIGFLFAVVVGSIGLGAVVMTRFGTQDAEESGRRALPAAPQLTGEPPAPPPAEDLAEGSALPPAPEPGSTASPLDDVRADEEAPGP